MSSIDYSSFYKEIQRKHNDYSSVTLDLIKSFTADRIADMQEYCQWPELYKTVEFTTVANVRSYQLSSFGREYKTDGIRFIKEPEVGVTLNRMGLERYIEIVPDYTKITDRPTHVIPVNDTEFYLYPTPISAKILSMGIQVKHKFMSANSHYFDFTDERVRVLKYGVLADMYEDKDDNRFQVYMQRYLQGLRTQRGNLHRNINKNMTYLPGNSVE